MPVHEKFKKKQFYFNQPGKQIQFSYRAKIQVSVENILSPIFHIGREKVLLSMCFHSIKDKCNVKKVLACVSGWTK